MLMDMFKRYYDLFQQMAKLVLKINVQPLLQKKGLRGQDPILANQDQNQLHYRSRSSQIGGCANTGEACRIHDAMIRQTGANFLLAFV